MNITRKQLMQLARRFDAVVRQSTSGFFIVYAGGYAPYITSSTIDAADHIRSVASQAPALLW